MEQDTKYCPNCCNQFESNYDECPRCFTKISRNLENFLLAKYKLFTLIGVFGALSIYLLNQNGDNQILHAGSFFSLIIVIILSLICVWDLICFIKIEESDYKEFPWTTVITSLKILPTLFMFLVFFIGLILILTGYVVSDKRIFSAIIYTIFLIAFSIFAITIYFIYRYLIEKALEKLPERLPYKLKPKILTIRLLILGVFSFFLILATTQIAFNQITGVVPLDVGDVSVSCIISISILTLLTACLKFMFKDMTLLNF